jgi:hypothetical protein
MIESCEFTGNSAAQGGGAISLRYSSPGLWGCSFNSNTAHGGGAIWMQQSNPDLAFSSFVADSANLGGAVQCDLSSAPIISDCTMCGTKASAGGCGVHVRESSSATLIRTIISNGTIGEAVHCDPVHPGTATLECCNLYGNAGGDWVGCIAGQADISGNRSTDPRFCGGLCMDLTLSSISPCLHAPCGPIGASGMGCWDERPGIVSITDVGNDQGRFVRLKWVRSVYDAPGDSVNVTGYAIYRRQDAFLSRHPDGGRTAHRDHMDVLGLSGWDYLHTIPARGDSIYQSVVPTLCDSTEAEGICWSVFMVSAMTDDPFTYYDSYPDSGYSVDNLAPAPPPEVWMEGCPEYPCYVVWEESSDQDVQYYGVYGSDQEEFDSDLAVHIGSVAGTQVDVSDHLYQYYHVTATDFGGNEGAASSLFNVCASVNPVPTAPTAFALRSCVPNPFALTTSIHFNVPRQARLSVKVYDAAGRLVESVTDGTFEPGRHSVEWTGRDAAGKSVGPGIYFVRMEAGGFSATRKLILLR